MIMSLHPSTYNKETEFEIMKKKQTDNVFFFFSFIFSFFFFVFLFLFFFLKRLTQTIRFVKPNLKERNDKDSNAIAAIFE